LALIAASFWPDKNHTPNNQPHLPLKPKKPDRIGLFGNHSREICDPDLLKNPRPNHAEFPTCAREKSRQQPPVLKLWRVWMHLTKQVAGD
jgi:hypothetical protein